MSRMQSVILAAACIALGYLLAPEADPAEPAVHRAATESWTCSMHPEIRLPEPGLCPICNMDLIPATEGDDVSTGNTLTLSPEAVALAGIRTVTVRRQDATHETRLVGRIEYDERYRERISAWIDGRIDVLHADFTGTRVTKGDHMVDLYSPGLIVAQQELLSAHRNRNVDEMSAGIYRSTREKLRLWGLAQDQIDGIVARGSISDHVTIRAPVSGLVTRRHVARGQYVKTGQPLFDIADPSRLWLLMDAYESDLPWLFPGQEVDLQADALPGETFSGTVAFIHPEVDESTRTVKVRVNVPNPDGRLRPGQYASATIRARVNADGSVRRPDLSGKWVSPMHPEVVKDAPGTCDVCGMDLVTAESLGLVDDREATTPVVVPATALLLTGRRAIAYVRRPGHGKPAFAGREVRLGPRTGDTYVVLDGLEPGDVVVVEGNFKIDSALQIRARPSMMNDAPDEGAHEGSEGSEGSGGHD